MCFLFVLLVWFSFKRWSPRSILRCWLASRFTHTHATRATGTHQSYAHYPHTRKLDTDPDRTRQTRLHTNYMPEIRHNISQPVDHGNSNNRAKLGCVCVSVCVLTCDIHMHCVFINAYGCLSVHVYLYYCVSGGKCVNVIHKTLEPPQLKMYHSVLMRWFYWSLQGNSFPKLRKFRGQGQERSSTPAADIDSGFHSRPISTGQMLVNMEPECGSSCENIVELTSRSRVSERGILKRPREFEWGIDFFSPMSSDPSAGVHRAESSSYRGEIKYSVLS